MKLWIAVLGFVAAGCGTGVDPLAVAVGNGAIPQLGPISTSIGSTTLTQGYSTANPYWTFNFTTFTGNYLAPADGIVTQIGLSTIGGQQTNYVTIVHTGGRLASRFFGVQNIVVRQGDSVFLGQAVGTFFNAFTGVQFQVILDGSPVCPLSFMSNAFRQSFSSWVVNSPCI